MRCDGKSRRDEEWSTALGSVHFDRPTSMLSASMSERDVERAQAGTFASVVVQLEPSGKDADGKGCGLAATESGSSAVHVIG